MPKNTTQCPRPGLELEPLAPESSALTGNKVRNICLLRKLRTRIHQLLKIRLQVTFEGIVGSSYTGDVALDQVKITEGSCPGKYIYINYYGERNALLKQIKSFVRSD